MKLELRAPPFAADSGCESFETSIHAQPFRDYVMRLKNDRAKDVRLEHSGPTISGIAPRGRTLPPEARAQKGL
jgi:hypothetical protein